MSGGRTGGRLGCLGRQQRFESPGEFARRTGNVGHRRRVDPWWLERPIPTIGSSLGMTRVRDDRIVRHRIELRLGCRLAVTGVAGFDANVDEFHTQRSRLVLGLDHVGSELVDIGAEYCDRHVALDHISAKTNRDLLGGVATLFFPPEGGMQVTIGFVSGHPGRQFVDSRFPPVRALQPQETDRIDQFGEYTSGDCGAEPVVAVDGPT